MEKLGTLLWILFAIGAFVFQMLKKMRETAAQESRERPSRPAGQAVPGLPAATFQEMLKQMQTRNAAPDPTGPPAPAAQPAPPKAPKTLAGRPVPRETARPARSQERAGRAPRSLEAPATARPRNAPAPPARRSATQPRASTEAPITDYWQTPPAARETPVGDLVRRLLHQPNGRRAAFVLSEVLRRRDY